MRSIPKWGSLLLGGILLGCTTAPPQSPQEATFRIDDESFTLSAGTAVVEQVPGAASQTVVRIHGEPVWGDLDGDGVVDAALLLVRTSGGSGTFYYLAAALDRGGRFVGTRAVFVGDRIAPRELAIRYGVVVFDYADRRPDEPMAIPATLPESKYLVCRGETLAEITPAGDEVLVAGEVAIGPEGLSFTPCGSRRPASLADDSPAWPAVQTAYRRALTGAPAGSRLLMVLTGRPVAASAGGRSAGSLAEFRATGLVLVRPDASCDGGSGLLQGPLSLPGE